MWHGWTFVTFLYNSPHHFLTCSVGACASYQGDVEVRSIFQDLERSVLYMVWWTYFCFVRLLHEGVIVEYDRASRLVDLTRGHLIRESRLRAALNETRECSRLGCQALKSFIKGTIRRGLYMLSAPLAYQMSQRNVLNTELNGIVPK